MGKTTYVFHCDKCDHMIEKDKREQAECPVGPSGPIDGFPMVSWANLTGTEYGMPKDGRKPYFDEGLDQMIYSKEHKKEVLQKHGLRQVDSGARKAKKKPLYFT